MATPTFTGEEYLSALSEFPGGPQGLIDAAVERFGAQGLTATPRGDDFSLYVPGEFMSSGRPMNYASPLANPTLGGSYYDYLYSTPAFKDIYTNILSPTITGFQPQVIAPEQPALEPTPQVSSGFDYNTLPYVDYKSALETYTPQQIVGQLETQFPNLKVALTGSGGINIEDPGVASVGNFPFTNVLDPKNNLEGFYNTLIGLEDEQSANIVNQYLAPAFSSLAQQQPQTVADTLDDLTIEDIATGSNLIQSPAVETRPIAKAGGAGLQTTDTTAQLPGLQVTPPVEQTITETPKKQLELPQITESLPPASTKTIQTNAAQPQIAEQKQPAVEQSVGDVLDNLDFENDPDATSKLINSFAGTEVIDIKTGREQISKTAPAPTPSYTRANYQPYMYEDNLRDLFNKNTMASRLGSFSPPADAYLKGGRDYISYDGPGGFADIMSKSMTDPRFVSGESVGLPTVTYRSKGNIIEAPDYLQLDPRMNVGDVVIPYAGQSRGQDEKIKRILADIPDGVFWERPDTWKFSDENLPNGLKAAIQDLVSVRATEDGDTVFVEAREGIEGTEDPFDYVRDDVSVLEQWLGIRFTDAEKQAMYGSGDAEDFRFYEHPGVRKKFSDGLDTLSEAADLVRKGLFGQTPYGPEEENKQPLDRVTARVRSLGNTLAELNSEVSTLIELEGDTRKSIGTYDPKFPTLKGLLQLATGQGLSDIDKQKYGSLNVGALATLATIAATAPQATTAVLGLQITNTLRKITPQILNVATFKEADYSGGLFSDVVEFSGEVMRPIGRFFVENIFQKINKNAPDDANLRSQFESLFEGDKPQNFAEYLEPEATVVVNRPDFPSVDPTGKVTLEAPTVRVRSALPPALNIERPVAQTPITSRTLTPIEVAYETAQQPEVVGGTQPVVGPITGQTVVEGKAPISLGDIATSPLTEVPFDRGDVLDLSQPRIDPPQTVDAFGRDIATLGTEFEFVPEVDSRPRLGATTGTTPFGPLTRAFTPLTAEAAEIEDLDIFTGVPDPSTLPTDLGDGETVDIEIQDDLFRPSVDVKNYPGTDTPSESSPTEDRSDDWNTVLENLPEDVKETKTILMKEFEYNVEGRLKPTGRVLSVPQKLELVANENTDGSVTYGYKYQDYDQAIVNYLIQAKQTNVVDANVNYSSHVRKDGELIGYNAKAGDKVYTIPEDLDYENYKTIQMPSGETPSDFVEPPHLSVDEINTQATELSSNLTKAAKDTLGDLLDTWPKAQTRSPKSGRLYSEIIKDQYDTLIANGESPFEALSITLAVSRQYAPASLRYGANYTKEFTDELEEKLSGSFSDIMYGTRELDSLNIGAIANFNYQPVVINAALRNLKLPEFDFGDKLNIVSRLKDYQPGGYQKIADNVGLDNPFKIPDLNVQIDSGGGVQIIAP